MVTYGCGAEGWEPAAAGGGVVVSNNAFAAGSARHVTVTRAATPEYGVPVSANRGHVGRLPASTISLGRDGSKRALEASLVEPPLLLG